MNSNVLKIFGFLVTLFAITNLSFGQCHSNFECVGRTVLTTSTTQTILCNGTISCQSNGDYWYEIDVATPMTLDFYGPSGDLAYHIYGPYTSSSAISCVPADLNDNLWLDEPFQFDQRLEEEIILQGVYVIKLSIQVECPTINLNISPSSCPLNADHLEDGIINCEGALPVCEDLSQLIDCNCGQELFWYEVEIESLGQTITASVQNQLGENQALFFGVLDGTSPLDFPCTLEELGPNIIVNIDYDPSSGDPLPSYLPAATGTYLIAIATEAHSENCPGVNINIDVSPNNSCMTATISCENCIPSFSPEPGKEYLIGAWVKDDDFVPSMTEFTDPQLKLIFDTGTSTETFPATATGFQAEGAVIDGWQRIEAKFTVPVGAINMKIEMICETGNCYFDDIRVFPFDASMKTYVYDPVFMRLAAELDERHYATFYEYNEEGQLTRIKKETEKGVMTIQETRNNSSKKP